MNLNTHEIQQHAVRAWTLQWRNAFTGVNPEPVQAQEIANYPRPFSDGNITGGAA